MRIAINGFGRIGRNVTRELYKRQGNLKSPIELVAINDLGELNTLTHLLKYDSVHGRFPTGVKTANESIIIDEHAIAVSHESAPNKLNWKELNIDVVLEATGFFRTKELANGHMTAGAKQVIISAPAIDSGIPTVVLGVNETDMDFGAEVISNASCTTNNVGPMFKVLQDNWGIESAYITTVHSYTSDQRLHDAPHKDLRRARSAPNSIVPTTTGAAKAITRIFPELEGNVGGCGIRVPVPNGSMTDVNCVLKHTPTVEEINQAFYEASKTELGRVLYYETDPLVSIDIVGNPYSCVFDSQLTSVVGNMVKVVGWYDNEIGYSNRLIDLMAKLKS
ncbi:MAG: type I glyceraldehyde-3-phosphate dehydrogenase [Crocinitomicaceae bacterium]|nr:type I glyceraldehyde-3-phosphate dehydrogenase [Crocinitomicaceae bacterium]|tara:strand:+ start:1780 stop:2784 length:1005 start_codon:yes stop_codon:yes gene_type:complete